MRGKLPYLDPQNINQSLSDKSILMMANTKALIDACDAYYQLIAR